MEETRENGVKEAEGGVGEEGGGDRAKPGGKGSYLGQRYHLSRVNLVRRKDKEGTPVNDETLPPPQILLPDFLPRLQPES